MNLQEAQNLAKKAFPYNHDITLPKEAQLYVDIYNRRCVDHPRASEIIKAIDCNVYRALFMIATHQPRRENGATVAQSSRKNGHKALPHHSKTRR